MNSLRELQERCYRAFALGDAASLVTAVRSNGVSAEDRIGIYQNNARETFRKSLGASYPVIERLVGAACFEGLALKFMREQPSRSGDLQRFGAGFADFLAGIYATTQFAYLTDVARLEWALEEVHLEPDETPLDPAELSTVAPDDLANLTFRVRRAVRLIQSPFPILSIWRANQPEADARVDLDKGAECVAVLRRGDDLEMHPLDHAAFELASRLADASSLQQAWEAVTDECDDVPELATALQSVMRLGLLSSFDIADSPAPLH